MYQVTIQNKPTDQLLRLESIRDNYTYQTRHWTRWMRETGHEVDTEGIRAYFEHLDTSGYTAGTIRIKRQAVKKRIRQVYHSKPLEERMKIDQFLKDLDQEMKPPKINTNAVPRNRVISRAEYDTMLQLARSPRQMAFIRFLWQTGCRVSELTGVQLRNCEVGDTSVRIRIMGKGKKERFIRIERGLYDFIREVFRGEEYLFETAGGKRYQRCYVSLQIKKIAQLIGRNISAHCMRHSWATRKIHQIPEKLDAISTYLGHSSTAITLNMYTHSELSDSELFS